MEHKILKLKVGQILTDIALRKLAAGEKRIEIWDAKIPGFGVRVSTSGTKSFVLVYRFRGQPRRLTLGRYPLLSLADARELATAVLRNAKLGIDPEAGQQAPPTAHQFDAAVADFVETHCRRHNRPSTAGETERNLRVHFVSRWGRRDIREITRADVHAVLDSIVMAGTPSAANHALASVRKLFNWAIERSLLETSPCSHVQRPAKVSSRDRVLTEKELASIYSCAKAAGYPFGSVVELLVLTGQRRGEVTGMQWGDLDFDKRLWTIPGDRTKNSVTHTVPLSTVAIELIRSLPKISDKLVFPSIGEEGRTISGFSKAKGRLDACSGVAGWTLHDLRRTLATELARAGTSPHVIERILNHKSGILGGVAGVYNRFGYLPEMRAALELWGDRVSMLVAEHPRL